MTKAELINELNSLFGKNRDKLCDRLKVAMGDIARWENIGAEIHKKTRQPIRGAELISEDMAEWIKNPKAKIEDIGDCSFYYEIILNGGVKDGMDWDIELAERCKGGSKICTIWSSLLFPYYSTDYYLMKYIREIDEIELLPYRPSTKREVQIEAKINDIFKSNGLKLITPKLANTIVPKAMTDVKDKGKATVFACLFSDIHEYKEDYFRGSCFDDKKNRLDHIFPGTEISWNERLSRKNKVIERYVSIHCPSGELVHIDLDDQYRIEKVKYSHKLNKSLTLDVKKKKLV